MGKGDTSSGEVVVATVKHDCGIVLYQGHGVGMEITEHGVASPTTYNTDDVRVLAAEEESHGAAASQGPSGDVFGVDAGVSWEGESSNSKEICDQGGGHISLLGGKVEESMEGGRGWGVVLTKMEHSSQDCTHWAAVELSIGGVGQLFTFDTILLVSEREGDEGGRPELDGGRHHHVRKVQGTNLEFDVAESKGMGSFA